MSSDAAEHSYITEWAFYRAKDRFDDVTTPCEHIIAENTKDTEIRVYSYTRTLRHSLIEGHMLTCGHDALGKFSRTLLQQTSPHDVTCSRDRPQSPRSMRAYQVQQWSA